MKKIAITPIPKPRMTQRDRWAKRPVILRYYDFADKLREQWGDTPLPDALVLTFYMPMPKSWSKKKKQEMAGSPHQQKPDIDNLCKAFMDALYEEDSVIYNLSAIKVWAFEPSITIKM